MAKKKSSELKDGVDVSQRVRPAKFGELPVVVTISSDELLEAARNHNVRSARTLLLKIAHKLKGQQLLDPTETDFIVGALEEAAINPKGAARAFCLVRPRAAPRKSKFPLMIAGKRVLELIEQKVPLTDGTPRKGWNGEGAISRVAEELGISEEKVKRGYTAWRAMKKRISDGFDDMLN